MPKFLLLSLFLFHGAIAEEAIIAVASNFSAPMKALAKQFNENTGHNLQLVLGSSGKLFAQIRQGAPFDVLLSADNTKSKKLIELNLAVKGSEFTYARGALVLWSRKASFKPVTEDTITSGEFSKLALANPKLAPYGRAAVEVLVQLGVYSAVEAKLVQGESVAQAFQFVHSYNADLGFVARAQLTQLQAIDPLSYWPIPNRYHQPILQSAVLLKAGSRNKAALDFLHYLQSPSAQNLITSFGYAENSMNKNKVDRYGK